MYQTWSNSLNRTSLGMASLCVTRFHSVSLKLLLSVFIIFFRQEQSRSLDNFPLSFGSDPKLQTSKWFRTHASQFKGGLRMLARRHTGNFKIIQVAVTVLRDRFFSKIFQS
jgi:hypothetical protein